MPAIEPFRDRKDPTTKAIRMWVIATLIVQVCVFIAHAMRF